MHYPRAVEAQVPTGLDVHLVMDNYATRKTPAVRRWLPTLVAIAGGKDLPERPMLAARRAGLRPAAIAREIRLSRPVVQHVITGAQRDRRKTER